MQDPDTQLMLIFQQGDEGAFERLVELHRVRVFNVAHRYLADKDAAEDIAQDVFVRVYAYRKKYRPKAKFSTWLYRITVNACLDSLRKHKKYVSLSEVDERIIDEPSPHEVLQANELVQQVRSAVLSLPDNQRIAVILQRYEGLSYDEIAEIMKVSRPSVESLLFRARQSLKVKLASSSEATCLPTIRHQTPAK